MTRIAIGSDNMEVADWVPSKICLSVPLMWDILQFNSAPKAEGAPQSSLLDASLTPVVASADEDENSTLEIVVAKSSEVTINIADGGQRAPPVSSKKPQQSSRPAPPQETTFATPTSEQLDSLTFNTTPWLYADSSQLFDIGNITYPQMESGNEWWEGANNNVMFNHFW